MFLRFLLRLLAWLLWLVRLLLIFIHSLPPLLHAFLFPDLFAEAFQLTDDPFKRDLPPLPRASEALTLLFELTDFPVDALERLDGRLAGGQRIDLARYGVIRDFVRPCDLRLVQLCGEGL